jgi:SAM-dependent methyltransferase
VVSEVNVNDSVQSVLRMNEAEFPRRQQCALCGATDVDVEERIDTTVLSRLYRQMLGIDLTAFFAATSVLELCKCNACDFRYFYPSITGDADFYRQLKKHDWYYIKEKQEFLFAGEEIGTDDAVLDVGCGDGNFARYIRAKQYVGLELNPAAVEEARSRNLAVFADSIEEYASEKAGTIDVVCAFQVLEHVTDPRSFIESCVHCLKPGGRLIISVPSADSFLRFAFNNVLNCPPHHVSWWSDEALRSIGRLFGLQVKRFYNDHLADEHLEAYLNTLIIRALDSRVSRLGLVGNSVRFRVYAKLASLLLPFLRMAFNHSQMRPRGHSSTVVFVAPGR